MKKIYKLLMMAAFSCMAAGLFAQGTTTSGINGKISDKAGSPLPGATVLAVESSTGAQYGSVSDDKGFYRIPNMNPGGPYKITVSFVGFHAYENDNVYLTLGQMLKIDVTLSESSTELTGVEIVAQRNDIFDGNRTGSETNISTESINRMPSVGRNISDYARLTPEVTVNSNGGLSIAGMNNRYNAIFIDGAVNNDVFGLASTGTNGGQIGISPFSMDIIDQINIDVAPYDVKQGGFAGGGINAVTRRGTNDFSGSAYYYFRNQSIAGMTPTDDETVTRKKLADFTSNTYGFRLGGPIIKDKLFFFVNAEIQKDETPNPYNFNQYNGSLSRDSIVILSNFVNSEYGYDPGTFESATSTLDSRKFFGRIDWNISKQHKLMIRHQYTYGRALLPGRSSNSSITFSNAGQDFKSVTNTTAIELKSSFSNKYSNDLLVGLTFVRDDRDPMGGNFPYVRIKDGTSNVYFGSEQYSTANILNQDIITVTDNFEIYKGSSTFTIGTNNEFYKFYNLFIRQNFGSYQFANLSTFLNGGTAYQYDRTFSLLDDVTGDGSIAAAKFNAIQFGVYGQWEMQWTDNFKTTVGLRLDVPMYTTQPPENVNFNDTIIGKLESTYGFDFKGAKSGKMPAAQLMFAPRIGFNWDVKGDQTTQIRGGLGIFTSRLPFVWPGGAYTNNGITLGGMRTYDVAFNPVWNEQPSLPAGLPSGEVDVFAKNFKFPQILRTSVSVDQKLPWGIVGTVEFTYSKTLNNVLYHNFRYYKNGETLTGTGDDRPLWSKVDLSNTNSNYTDIVLGENTSEGNAYNFTIRLLKDNWNGLSFMLAYSYGYATSMNDGVSSQNISQLKVPNVRGMNDLDLSYSDYMMGSKFNAFVNYKVEYVKHMATTIGLYYNGQYGQRYSYGYADGTSVYLGEDNQDLELMYIPKDQNDINLVDILNSDGTVKVSAADQWTALDNFISNDKYLSNHRGEYAERNGARTPLEHIVDLHLAQDFYIETGKGKRNTIQITFDVFNFTNMLNKNWGRRYYVSGYYNNYTLVDFAGFEEDGTTPTFQFTAPKGDVWNIDDSGLVSSRWQAQVGIRYIFN